MLFKLSKPLNSRSPHIQCDKAGEVLKAFFETEIQEDTAFAKHLLSLCLDPQQSQTELSGNLYNILIKNDKFIIENIFDETETVTNDKTLLARILEQWLSLVERP